MRTEAITTGGHRAARLEAALSPLLVLATFATLLLADRGSAVAGDSVVPGGPLDEAAHALTTLVVFAALTRPARRRFLPAALVASVAIDADHVPGRLGIDWITAGTPRPYPHSLLSIVLVVALAWGWRARRDVLLGVAIGLAWHFLRDLGENGSGVSLLWPVSGHVFTVPHPLYLGVMAGLALVAVIRRRPDVGGEPAAPPAPAPAG